MQALAGTRTSLGCSDCKTNFSSASSLLRHFAEHISGVTAREGSTESESDDARSESILERALRSSASGSSSAESPASISDEINKKADQIPEISITKIEAHDEVPMMYELTKGNNNNNNNNTSNKHVMYVKLDLQKRVEENCVHHLKGSGDSSDEDSAKGDSTEEGTAATAVETDDFNPLKFCVVTLEEGSEKIELNESKVSVAPVNNLPSTDTQQQQQQQQYKKYVCTYCFKRFGWSTDLKRHILTHTGERPFQCQLCGATFTRNFLLQKHVLKLHKPVEQTAPPLTSIKSEPSLTEMDLSPHTLKDSPLSLSKRRKQGILVEGDKS